MNQNDQTAAAVATFRELSTRGINMNGRDRIPFQTLLGVLEQDPNLRDLIFGDKDFPEQLQIIEDNTVTAQLFRAMWKQLHKQFLQWIQRLTNPVAYIVQTNNINKMIKYLDNATMDRMTGITRYVHNIEDRVWLNVVWLESVQEQRARLKTIHPGDDEIFLEVGIYAVARVLKQNEINVDGLLPNPFSRDLLNMINDRNPCTWWADEAPSIVLRKIDDLVEMCKINIRFAQDTENEPFFFTRTLSFDGQDDAQRLWLTSLLLWNSLQLLFAIIEPPTIEDRERLDSLSRLLNTAQSRIIPEIKAVPEVVWSLHSQIMYICSSMANHLLEVSPRDEVQRIILDSNESNIQRRLHRWLRRESDDLCVQPKVERDPVFHLTTTERNILNTQNEWLAFSTGKDEPHESLEILRLQDPVFFRELGARLFSQHTEKITVLIRTVMDERDVHDRPDRKQSKEFIVDLAYRRQLQSIAEIISIYNYDNMYLALYLLEHRTVTPGTEQPELDRIVRLLLLAFESPIEMAVGNGFRDVRPLSTYPLDRIPS